MSSSEKAEHYYYCFYHIYTVRHANYHHVIMKLSEDDIDMIKTMEGDGYQYCLISSQPKFLDESDLADDIIRGLVMDGESLLKKIKAQNKKIYSTMTK